MSKLRRVTRFQTLNLSIDSKTPFKWNSN